MKTLATSHALVSERDFVAQIIDLAHIYGWRIVHFRAARTKWGWATPCQGDAKGWPDTILIHPKKRRLIFAELKSENGKLSDEQETWIAALVGLQPVVATEVYVWRPSNFNQIAELLR